MHFFSFSFSNMFLTLILNNYGQYEVDYIVIRNKLAYRFINVLQLLSDYLF